MYRTERLKERRNRALLRFFYCDGAEWHGGTMMPISQFLGRLARANRAPKSTIIIIITTDEKEDRHGTRALLV
jgi:hypothetical protein